MIKWKDSLNQSCSSYSPVAGSVLFRKNGKLIPVLHMFRFQVSANTSFGCTLSSNYSSAGNILELFKLLF